MGRTLATHALGPGSIISITKEKKSWLASPNGLYMQICILKVKKKKALVQR
jgi:hypothetical protein